MSLQGSIALAFGILIGWVVNYLADVLPRRGSLLRPTCPECQTPTSWAHLLWGKPCPQCPPRLPLRFWLVMLVAVAGSVWIALAPPPRIGMGWGYWCLAFFLLIVTIDVEHRLVLHLTTLVGGAVSLVMGVMLRGWSATLLGLVAGFGIMFALYGFGILFSRWMSRVKQQEVDPEALGFGDVTLSAVLGLMAGWPAISLILVAAILLGGIVSGFYLLVLSLLKRYNAFTAIPYAPFLVLAAAAMLFLVGR